MATQTEQQRKATAQKAAATRRRNAAKRSQSARKAAETRAQAELSTAAAVQAQAERAVLIPVGAALVARDAVVDAAKPYVEGRESAEKELTKLQKRVSTNLRKFERRGTTARNRALREVKRTRTRFERELRQRRGKAVRTVKGVRGRRASGEGHRPRGAASGRGPRAARGRPRLEQRTSPRPVGETGTGVRLPANPAVQYLSSLSRRRPSGRRRPLWAPAGERRFGVCDNRGTCPPRARFATPSAASSTPSCARTSSRSGWSARSSSRPRDAWTWSCRSPRPGCPIRAHFEKAVIESVSALDGVEIGDRRLRRAERRGEAGPRAALGRQGGLPEGALAAVKNVICVGSGKGGVGKSTLTANLAAALQAEGHQAAALDADVWGYSIPRMLGVHGRPRVSARAQDPAARGPRRRDA